MDRSGGYNLLCDKSITIHGIGCKIPQEVWKGYPCDYSKLRVFGCDAYALVPKHERTKLDPKSKRYIFVGYGDGTKGFRLWDPTTRKIIINRDVRFNESSLVQLDVDRRLKHDAVSDFQHIQFDNISNDSHNDHSSDSSHEQVSESDYEQGSDGGHEQVSDGNHEEIPTIDRKQLKWVLRYLRGTSNYCISCNKSIEFVCGYVDSDFAGDLDKRRSTSGYVFTLAGGAIS